MNEHIDPEWRESLQQMAPQEKLAFLRSIVRLRAHCPRCLVKFPRLDIEPCYSCTTLPGGLGRPMMSRN